ncbi:hypothetical protein L1887_11848 [Cichorium endivia]|nr:hypothetical protein L1887_11848 [Cichorium endivia]
MTRHRLPFSSHTHITYDTRSLSIALLIRRRPYSPASLLHALPILQPLPEENVVSIRYLPSQGVFWIDLSVVLNELPPLGCRSEEGDVSNWKEYRKEAINQLCDVLMDKKQNRKKAIERWKKKMSKNKVVSSASSLDNDKTVKKSLVSGQPIAFPGETSNLLCDALMDKKQYRTTEDKPLKDGRKRQVHKYDYWHQVNICYNKYLLLLMFFLMSGIVIIVML